MPRPKGAKNKPKYPEHVKYREDWVWEWLLELAGGKNIREIYESNRDKFPHQTTVGNWLMTHPEFKEKYYEAKRIGSEIDHEEMKYIADNCGNDSVSVQKARLMIDVRMKTASKLLPQYYGESIKIEQEIDDKRELDTKSVDDALARIQDKFTGKQKDNEETIQ